MEKYKLICKEELNNKLKYTMNVKSIIIISQKDIKI
jgi:hypothetical protein